MTLANMMATDADALTCDFAETYHVLDWRSLPMRLAGTLASGLGYDSRIRTALNGTKVPTTTIFLSLMTDALMNIAWQLGGTGERPTPLTPLIMESDNEDDYGEMDAEDFDAWRRSRLEG